ncbi:MAG: 3-oxoacid CoA-transferase subunit A [Bacilli bacterium]|nr:3-oxoacid CoA-transferase subunit A [Bacilli bacterium]MDD3422066.1 3-oxoacid CoA-transferase subunit A [Bacilli bacterium]MDD4065791.1 3-oxoacid CoA-transferase subunit A [Bacilli bacterium]
MKNKIIEKTDIRPLLKDGMSIMIGGFLSVGSAETVIDQVVASGVKNLTIYCNDGGLGEKRNKETGELIAGPKGAGKLIASGQCTTLYATHIGLNPLIGKKMNTGEMKVVLIPQGSFAEMIRAGGSGLGGIITPTGVGVDIIEQAEHVYKKIKLGDKKKKTYLIEKPLHADLTIIKGAVVDKLGNVYFNKTTQNFSRVMAYASDVVVCEAQKIVERGEIDGNAIHVPGVLVDYIVKEEK